MLRSKIWIQRVSSLDDNLPALPLPCTRRQPISTKGTRGAVAVQERAPTLALRPASFDAAFSTCITVVLELGENFLHVFHTYLPSP
jgi:hypothetical protein